MEFILKLLAFLLAVWHTLWDVAMFWRGKTTAYVFGRSPKQVWTDVLRTAANYDEWAEAAQQLDIILGLDMWRHNPTSKDYDYRLISDRVRLLDQARHDGNLYSLFNVLRAGLIRNLGNITTTKLFNRSFAGTKLLIEEYVQRYVEAVQELAALPSSIKQDWPGSDVGASEYEDGVVSGSGSRGGYETGNAHRSITGTVARCGPNCKGGMAKATISGQFKLNFIHDTRQGFGRTALVLQGGAIFGLCHLGVVKALLEQGLLPRVIVGTATGAMLAALVGVHPTEDLHGILRSDGIDLSAFAARGKDPDLHNQQVMQSTWTRWATLIRRVQRFRKEGYFLDVKVLEDCVRANIGDLTFEEAFNRSKRILNITVVPAGQEGIPTLLNYVTAPNVLVWTAAVASNASTKAFYGHRQTKILCKDAYGNIKPWAPMDTVDFSHWTSASYSDRNAPLNRVAGLFNVNHYIVSQARPYLIPFLQSDMHGPSVFGKRANWVTRARVKFLHLLGLETRHWLRMADRLHLLPPSIRRFLVDEHLPGPSITIVPKMNGADFIRLLETPTPVTLAYWIHKGERSVWPAVVALRVRCGIEMELERAYQDVRRLKPGELRRKASALAAKQLEQQQQKKALGGGQRLAGLVEGPRKWEDELAGKEEKDDDEDEEEEEEYVQEDELEEAEEEAESGGLVMSGGAGPAPGPVVRRRRRSSSLSARFPPGAALLS